MAPVKRAAAELKDRLESQLGELGLPLGLADDLIDHYTLVNYAKGSIVYHQGSPADVVFYVIGGIIKVYCPRPDGTRILVKLAGPGDLVGYVNEFDFRGRLAQVFEAETLTKSSVAIFTREHLRRLLQSAERVDLLRLIEQMNAFWSAKVRWFATFLSMSFRDRLELELKELACRFGVRESRGILVPLELVHGDLADMIGSSRPMVSRLIAEMIKQRLLSRQGRQFILLEPMAREMCEDSSSRKLPFKNCYESASQSTAQMSPVVRVSAKRT